MSRQERNHDAPASPGSFVRASSVGWIPLPGLDGLSFSYSVHFVHFVLRRMPRSNRTMHNFLLGWFSRQTHRSRRHPSFSEQVVLVWVFFATPIPIQNCTQSSLGEFCRRTHRSRRHRFMGTNGLLKESPVIIGVLFPQRRSCRGSSSCFRNGVNRSSVRNRSRLSHKTLNEESKKSRTNTTRTSESTTNHKNNNTHANTNNAIINSTMSTTPGEVPQGTNGERGENNT